MSKKLFDLSLNASPALTKRLAIGDPDNNAENITLAQLIALLNDNLFNEAWPHFTLERVNTTFTITAANLYFYKVGKLAFIEFIATVNITSSSASLILQETSTTNAALRAFQECEQTGVIRDNSSNSSSVIVSIFDSSMSSDRFMIGIKKDGGGNLATGVYYLRFRTSYQCM